MRMMISYRQKATKKDDAPTSDSSRLTRFARNTVFSHLPGRLQRVWTTLRSIMLTSHPMPVEVSTAYVRRINSRRFRVHATGKNPVINDAVVDCAWITLRPQKPSDPSSDTLAIEAVWDGSGGSAVGVKTWGSDVDVDLQPGMNKVSIVGKNAQRLVLSVNGVPDSVPQGLRISRVNIESPRKVGTGLTEFQFRISVELTDNRGFKHGTSPYYRGISNDVVSVEIVPLVEGGNNYLVGVPGNVNKVRVSGAGIAPVVKELPKLYADARDDGSS